MLLSNQKIDYSTVRRIPAVKLTGQNQGTTANTNSMPTSTSLQEMTSHTQKFTWTGDENNKKDQRLVHFNDPILHRQLATSQSDERIFEHPEVTIIPSVLDDEIHRRLLTLKISNTHRNSLERDAGQSAPNILEHPDMRAPVVMQSVLPSSTSSSAFVVQNNFRRVSRTQSVDVYAATTRTPSPSNRVKFFIDNQPNSKRSISPGSFIGDIVESPDQQKNEDPPISTSLTTTSDSMGEYSKASSKSDDNFLQTKNDDLW